MMDQILKVGQSKDKELLTKSQKEFNRLTKRIAKLRTEIQQIEEVSDRLHQRTMTVLLPLQQKHAERRADLVRLLDKAYRGGSFKSRERKELKEIILAMAFNLIVEDGVEDLKEIYDRYSDISFDEMSAQMEQEAADNMRRMMEEMFGMSIDDDAELGTPEEMQALFEKQLEEAETLEAFRRQQQDARRANRPKTAKQLEKEQKTAEEEQKISKSVREVYLELAKAFHPDLEQDEQEKQRKTEVMQRIGQAYERNDLLTLLQLQLEYEQIDQDHLENIAEDRLKHFTKILQRQASELQFALYEAQVQLAQMTGHAQHLPPLYLESLFERNIKMLKKDLLELEKQLQHLSDPVYLKMWLKGA